MKKVLILTRREDRQDYDRKEAFIDAIGTGDLDNNYTAADYEDLLFCYNGERLLVKDTVSGYDLEYFDVIFMIGWFKTGLLSDVAKSVAHYSSYRGVVVLNSEALMNRSQSKLSQLVLAHDNDFPITPFLFSLDPQVLKKAIREHEGMLGSSFIVKAINGNKGNDNYFVGVNDVDEIIDTGVQMEKYFVVQWFVPNDGDYRIITTGEQVRIVLHRSAQQGSHLNNTSKGGEAVLFDHAKLPETLKQKSIALAKVLHKEVAGIDVIQHSETGEFYFLEINNMPQLATGSFVKQKIKALDDYIASI